MTDPWNPPQPGQQPAQPQQPYGQQPTQPYGQPYGQQPPTYGYPVGPPAGQGQYGSYLPQYDGPPGQVRSTGKVILLSIVTFGIYVFVYNYRVHDEMKRHSHRGVGGGIALLLSFVANVAMPFVTPSEVGNLYLRKGRKNPVSGWTGLWFLLPTALGYVGFIAAAIAGGLSSGGTTTTTTSSDFGTSTTSSDDTGLALAVGIGFLVYVVVVLTGAIIWTVKTNGALNRYWQTLQSGGFEQAAPA